MAGPLPRLSGGGRHPPCVSSPTSVVGGRNDCGDSAEQPAEGPIPTSLIRSAMRMRRSIPNEPDA